jgi:hypothetical protein
LITAIPGEDDSDNIHPDDTESYWDDASDNGDGSNAKRTELAMKSLDSPEEQKRLEKMREEKARRKGLDPNNLHDASSSSSGATSSSSTKNADLMKNSHKPWQSPHANLNNENIDNSPIRGCLAEDSSTGDDQYSRIRQ